jgi:DNA-binding beta-propeller fold protein YncE
MPARRRLAAAVTAAVLVVFASAVGGGASAHTDRLVFRIQPAEIDESSSLVVSQTHPRLVYTANDSGGSATVYVLDARTGELVGSTSIEGVEPVDIEAMTTAADGSLIVADIGDNDSQRADAMVYRIDQPGRGAHTVVADAVQVTYSDGPHDAESVVYDTDTGRLFVVSKEFVTAHVYRSPRDPFSHRQVVLRPVAEAPALATDAALLPSGDVAVIRTYSTAYFYTFPGWRGLGERQLPSQPQGESLAVPPDGDQLWVGSEGVGSRVLAVPMPDLARPNPSTSAPPTKPTGSSDGGVAEAENEHRDELKSRAVLVGGGALALLVVVAVVLVVRWHRHPHG